MTAPLLADSSRLGPYEILGLLGAGGMGEVYRARDTRLRRDVAVKVLSNELAGDRDLLKRLEREARSISQLNHPNIVAVYDVGSDRGVEYIVMEFLEGETLGSKLQNNGRLAPRKALEYATQVAHGLAAAHSKGIVHRDLKPENVFITREGRVKILDFGLANQVRGDNELNRASSRLTAPGMVMGTAAYMSPEQARGTVVDWRSDIFSFGSMLYEMLSGRLPFEKDTSFETMAAILNSEPPALEDLVPHLPPVLYRIIRRCLEKSPDSRFQSANDLVFDLENCSEVAWTRPSATIAVPEETKRWPVRMIAAIIATAIVAAAAATAYWKIWGTSAVPAPFFRRLTYRQALIQSARFTPDGQTVVYSASVKGQPLRVHLLRTDRPESQGLTIPGELAAISANGEMAVILNSRVLDWTGGGVLAQVPVLGGTPREILDGVLRADWAPDGRMAVWRRTEKGVHQLEFPLGNVLYSSPLPVFGLRVSPKGDQVALNIATSGQKTDIMLFGRDGTKRTLTSADVFARGMAWSPDGKELWFSIPRNTEHVPSIYGVTLDGRERLVMRTPAWPWLFDISRDGTVLMGLSSFHGGIMVPSGDGKVHDLSWLDASLLADISGDGKTIVFTEWNEGVQYKSTVYMRTTDESPAVRLGEGVAVAFSPRQDKVLALRTGPKRRELILLPTGPGKTETLPNDLDCLWGGFLPNGRILINAQTKEGPRMFIQSADGKPPRPLTPPGMAIGLITSVGGGAIKPISPDGKSLLLFDRNRRAWVFPIDEPGGKMRPATGVLPGEQPAGWSRDGRHIYVYQTLQMPVIIYDVDLVTGERKLLREVQVPDPEGVFRITPILLMPDGQSFAYGFYRMVSMLYTASGLK